MKWINNLIRKMLGLNIIFSKTILASMDILDILNEANKNFKQKIKK